MKASMEIARKVDENLRVFSAIRNRSVVGMSHLHEIRPEFYTRLEVQQKLGISEATIFRWLKEGTFPKPMKFGQKNMWRISTIEEWIAAQERGAA
jgi:predicted DNA-binding transcriptional regulator AlpA|tara:strand:- start:95 stop:379 length:285 start_codon:yes stop_codon:yes gene_type:complete